MSRVRDSSGKNGASVEELIMDATWFIGWRTRGLLLGEAATEAESLFPPSSRRST